MLDLAVIKQTPGELTTNINDLESQVLLKLKEYDPETYKGDVALAKKDRAELNKSAKALGIMRREIIARAMAPYSYFEEKCKKIEKDIMAASQNVDLIVRQDEDNQKEIKRIKIEEMFKERKFDLVSLDKIFKQSWLNKGTNDRTIEIELDAAIKTIYTNLKMIERMSGEDSDTIKALYLQDLNLEMALAKSDEIKENRARLEREKEKRAERENQAEINKLKAEAVKEYAKAASEENVANMVAAVMADDEDEPEVRREPERHCYYLRFDATPKELALVKVKLAEVKIKAVLEKSIDTEVFND